MPRPRHHDNNQLIEQAMYCFWARGYSSTGMRELESSLNLRAPAIYNRFGSKQALFTTSLEYYLERIVGHRIHHYLTDSTQAPPDRLAQFMRSAIFPRNADLSLLSLSPPQPLSSCLLVRTALDPVARSNDVKAILHRAQRTLEAAFTTTLAPLSAHADDTARQLLLCFNGLMVSQLCGHSRAELEGQLDATLALIPRSSASHNPSTQH
ncbi:MAG: TetR/AcrR family transcriptional regulator [Spongiibacter sp.]